MKIYNIENINNKIRVGDDIEIQDELYDRMEHVKLKDGGTEYYVEE